MKKELDLKTFINRFYSDNPLALYKACHNAISDETKVITSIYDNYRCTFTLNELKALCLDQMKVYIDEFNDNDLKELHQHCQSKSLEVKVIKMLAVKNWLD